MYSCKILADSVAPSGARLTSFEVTFPRFILAEVNTHRVLSRNSASSRAIPVAKQLKRITDDPFVPIYWGRNQAGMQAAEKLSPDREEEAVTIWLSARDAAIAHAGELLALDVHKQTVNRLLEPFAWHTAILTATTWDNFFHLRNHPDAQPEFQRIAALMQMQMQANEPEFLPSGEWHLPYVSKPEHSEHAIQQLIELSVARCARTSTLTQDGIRDVEKDFGLTAKLLFGGHISPMEHQGKSTDSKEQSGNFVGWTQYRKLLPYEHDPLNPLRTTVYR